jgi:hypothetical protein
MKYGSSFEIEVETDDGVGGVALIRPASVTHHTDAGQRHVRLRFRTQADGAIRITAPADGNTAPPGPYMLFVVDEDGVPSVASWVTVAR